jgi:thioesterase domain-containing protein
LQPNGSKPPLFLTPGLINPELLKYREMLPYLDPDQPVLGLQAAGVDRRSHPDSRVEEMAERYVDEIMRFQPHGPYRLAGLCFGGLVAYEVARRLAERGEEIALLTLIDSSPLVNRTLRGSRSRRELERLKWSVFANSSLQGKAAWILRRVKGIWGKVWFKTGRYVFERQVQRGRPLPRYPWNMVLIANVLAMERYAVAPSDARVTLISVDHGPDDKRLLRWRELARGGVDMRALSAPGLDHQTMMHEPFAQLVAAELTAALEGAASTVAGGSADRETVPSGDEDALAV